MTLVSCVIGWNNPLAGGLLFLGCFLTGAAAEYIKFCYKHDLGDDENNLLGG